MLDPFDTDQFIGDLLHQQDCPANYQHFKTVVRIKVDMEGGNDLIMMGMLVIRQLIGKIPNVVIVNQRHRADRFLILRSAAFLNQ